MPITKNFALKVLIVESDSYAALEVKSLVKSAGYQICSTIKNASDIVSAVSTHNPDLIISNNNAANIKHLTELRSLIKKEIPILFSSSYHQKDSSTGIPSMLPNETEFRKTIKELLRDLDSQCKKGPNKAFLNEDYLYFIKKGVFYKVNINEILFVKAIDDYSIIYTPEGEVTIFTTLGKVATLLQKHPFLQTHRSYIISEQKSPFFNITRNKLYIDSYQVPVSRAKKKEVIRRLKTTNIGSSLAY